jgi:lysine 6-dehydrogenase
MRFAGVGELEYFITDGLGTLPNSFPHINKMAEYTLRYPGHAKIMESLQVLGLLETAPIKVDGNSVEPRRVVLELMRLLAEATRKEDLLAFRVEVHGRIGRRPRSVTYQILDFYDPRTKTTAMARTTAYTCTAVTHLIAEGRIARKGVIPPEDLGREDGMFRFVRSFLRAHRVLLRIRSQAK